MRLLRKAHVPEPEMVPINFAAAVMDATGAPMADRYINEVPEWATLDELAQPPSVEELLRDPDVAAVVEAAGEGACLMASVED